MKGTYLGEFEEIVLLAVAVLGGKAYGINLGDTIKEETGRKVSLSSVHTALYRLERKGFVRSGMSEATKVRGGRRKRLYTVTAAGEKALVKARSIRDRLWGLIPDTNFGFSL